jgi:hypothetical protein
VATLGHPMEALGGRMQSGSWMQVGIAAPVIVAELLLLGFALNGVGDRSTGGGGSVAGTVRPRDFPASTPDPGVYERSRVRPNGRLVTDQWIAYPRPVRSVELTATSTQAIGGQVDLPKLAVRSVAADGKPIDAETRPTRSRHWQVRLADPARYLYVRYVVSGVTKRSQPSAAPVGRALVFLNSIQVYGVRGSARVAVAGRNVLSLACQIVDAPPVPCGRKQRDTWTVDLVSTEDSTQIFAQVELNPLSR